MQQCTVISEAMSNMADGSTKYPPRKPVAFTGHALCMLVGMVVAIHVNFAKELTLMYKTSYMASVRAMLSLVTMPNVESDDVGIYMVIESFLHISASLVSTIPFGTMAYQLELTNPGDMTAIIEFGGGLLLTGAICHLAQRERIGSLYYILLGIDCACVAVLVSRPVAVLDGVEGQDATLSPKVVGAISSLLAALFAAISPLLMKNLVPRKCRRCWVFSGVYGMAGMLLAGIWCTTEYCWVVPTTWFSVSLLATICCTNILQLAFGGEMSENTTVADFTISMIFSVLISYLLQATLFNHEMDIMSMLGNMVVTIGVFTSAAWRSPPWQHHSVTPLAPHPASSDYDGPIMVSQKEDDKSTALEHKSLRVSGQV